MPLEEEAVNNMVNCYLCKQPVKVSTEKHLYDEKLKKRYHLRCFAGICEVCDKPVYKKAKHKTVGKKVWHTYCYKTTHNWKGAPLKGPGTIETVDQKSWKAMEKARKASGVPKAQYRAFEEVYFREHPPSFVKRNPEPVEMLSFSGAGMTLEAASELEGERRHESSSGTFLVNDTPHNRKVLEKHSVPYTVRGSAKPKQAARTVKALGLERQGIPRTRVDAYLESEAEENPMLVTPQQETEIKDAYRRLKRGTAGPEDRELVEGAKRQGVLMGTGPSILVKKSPPFTSTLADIRGNPDAEGQRNYIILDESGKEFARGTATERDAKARAILLGQKYMREMSVKFQD